MLLTTRPLPIRCFTPNTAPLLLLMLAFLAAGCTTTPLASLVQLQHNNPIVKDCRNLYQALSVETNRQGVHDSQTTAIPDFPWLHVNRFLAGFNITPDNNDAFNAWLDRLQALALETHKIEYNNLPRTAKTKLQAGIKHFSDNNSVVQALSYCADVLRQQELTLQHAHHIRENARVKSDYQTWKRILGLYAFSAVPFAWGIQNWHDDSRETMQRASSTIPVKGKLHRYQPAPGLKPLTIKQAGQLITNARQNPLKIPSFNKEQAAVLFATHAPVFETDFVTGADSIGKPYRDNLQTPERNTNSTPVYTLLSYTYFRGEILPQLNYVIWFPSRPCTSFIDILCGELDGLIWRVTLDATGEPLHYDTVHNCGCYHTFFPTRALTKNPRPDTLEEWAFTPVNAPTIKPGQRILIRLESRTHHIQSLTSISLNTTDAKNTDTFGYSMIPYKTLRSLPVQNAVDNKNGIQTKSLFQADGLVAGTGRKERFLFWPMGIPSPGAMRQWGHHATAFIGQRYFDDPCLLQKYYRPTNNRAAKTAQPAISFSCPGSDE